MNKFSELLDIDVTYVSNDIVSHYPLWECAISLLHMHALSGPNDIPVTPHCQIPLVIN